MTTRPQRFTKSSDFASLKNDAKTTVTLTVPASMSIAGSSYWQSSQDVTIGTKNASTRPQIASSKDAGNYYAVKSLGFNRTGTESGFPAPYSVIAYISQPSAGVIRINAIIPNPYAGTLTTEAGAETFTFDLQTFLSPHE